FPETFNGVQLIIRHHDLLIGTQASVCRVAKHFCGMEDPPDVSPVLFLFRGQATACDKIQMARATTEREHFHPEAIQDRPDDIHHLLGHEEHRRQEEERFFWQEVIHLRGNLRDRGEQVYHGLEDLLEIEDLRITL